MSKIFKRPMFRKGGPTSGMNGIMTGIVDREKHAVSDPDGVGGQTENKDSIMNYINKVIPTESEMSAFKERMPQRPETEYQSFDPLTRFLLTFGPAYASTSPTGNEISTALKASQGPIQDLIKGKDLQRQEKREEDRERYLTESDAFSTLLEAKADALSGSGSQKTYRDIIVNKEVERLVPLISDLTSKLSDETLSDEQKIDLRNQLDSAQISLNNLKKSDPTGEALLEVFTKSPQGQNIFNSSLKNLFKTNPEKYSNLNDPQLLIDATNEVRKFLMNLINPRSQEKDGGRIGLQNGTLPVTQNNNPVPQVQGGGQNMSKNDNPISFDQLRARLPQEITNDIITLMSNSAEALNDFASISTQQDVNNFNKKFNVNLVLPAEA